MPTTDQTYIGLLNLRSRLEAKQQDLSTQLQMVTKQLDSVSVTLDLIGNALADPLEAAEKDQVSLTEVVPTLSIHNSTVLDISSLQGMTQLQALKKIALHFGGQFYTTAAKSLMLQGGLIKTAKNANNIIFNVIQRSGAFDRVSPGVYRLKTKPTRPERSISLPVE
jgi:hypothetical protein